MPFRVEAFRRTALSLQRGEELVVWSLAALWLSPADLQSWLLPQGAASSGREREPAAAAQPLTCQGQWPLAAALTAAPLQDFIVTANLISSHLVPHIIDWESKGSLKKEMLRFSKAIHHTCPSHSGQLSRQKLDNVVLCSTCKNSHHIANKGVSVKCIAQCKVVMQILVEMLFWD